MQSLEFSRSYMFYLYLFPSVYIISSRYRYIDCIYIITSYHSLSLRLPVFPISLFSLPSISISTSVYSLLLFVSFSVDIYIYISLFPPLALSLALSHCSMHISSYCGDTTVLHNSLLGLFSAWKAPAMQRDFLLTHDAPLTQSAHFLLHCARPVWSHLS